VAIQRKIWCGQSGRAHCQRAFFHSISARHVGDVEAGDENARAVQVVRVYARVHYMVCDARGACGAFEHLAGTLRISAGRHMPARVLTNTPYRKAAKSLAAVQGFGGRRKARAGQASVARFQRAAVFARSPLLAKGAVDRAFATLNNVQMGSYSKWQIVYQPHLRRAHFRLANQKSKRFSLDLRKLDFDCRKPVLMRDLTGQKALSAYTRAWNLSVIKKSVRRLRLPLSQSVLWQLALHPEKATRCR
jgi:hypothetical protein